LLRALLRVGLRFTIIAARNSPAHSDLPARALLPTVTPMRGALLLRQAALLPAVRHALRDCTHLHSLIEPYSPLAAGNAGTRPCFITAHGSYARLPALVGLGGAVYRYAFRRAQIVCVSRYTERILHEVLPAARTHVIPNGVEAAAYLDIKRTPDQPPLLLTVGAVKARKGVRELVAALAAVRAVVAETRLVIAGALEIDAPYVAQVRQDIAALGLSEAVTLAGRVSDEELRRLYARASLFALPAREDDGKFEGFGLALIEASAAGLPVISTLGSGTADAVDDGVTGLLVPQNDGGALANAIIRLLTDKALAEQMGNAGRRKAATQTWDAAAQAYVRLYERGGKQ
jgi:glycosyltransferase involved in cell wall biosynthesis